MTERPGRCPRTVREGDESRAEQHRGLADCAGYLGLPEPRATRSGLARPLAVERTWTPDREAMATALRVILRLPRVLPDLGGQEAQ